MKINLVMNNIGQIWIKNIPKSNNICGLLGNNNNIYNDDIILSNGTILLNFNQNNINLLGDSWIIPYNNQPLSCNLYPNNSYNGFMSCNINRKNVQKKCQNFIQNKLQKKKKNAVLLIINKI